MLITFRDIEFEGKEKIHLRSYRIWMIVEMKTFISKKNAIKNVENSESAQIQRQKWFVDLKQEALRIRNICSRNNFSYKPIVSVSYQMSLKMEEIMNELTKIAELQGEMDSIVNELSEKGGYFK